MNSLEEIVAALLLGRKAVICGHEMPDGDSIGSVLAMKLVLTTLGLECYAAASDDLPGIYGFLPGVDDIADPRELPADCDLAVLLDCTDLSRIGDTMTGLVGRVPVIINIDHHVSNQEFGTLNYVDPKAAATGEIVYDLVRKAGVGLSRDLALCIYTAIVMDTGSFQFDNTTDRTHEITAELIRTGLNIPEINDCLFEQKELTQMKLMGYALSRLKTAAGGRLAWITIPYEVMGTLGAVDEHVGGIVNYPRMLKDVEIGVLLREVSPGVFKVGFRSKQRVDVNQLASSFGGGGHPRASGCSVRGSAESVEKLVLDRCLEYLGEAVSIEY